MKARYRSPSRNFVAELIRCTNDHPAMFTFAIGSGFSPPEFPNVSPAVSLCSYHASVLHRLSFQCLKCGNCLQDLQVQFRHRLSMRKGKNRNKSRKVIAFLRRCPAVMGLCTPVELLEHLNLE